VYGDVCGMCGGDVWVGMCIYVCVWGGGAGGEEGSLGGTQEHNTMTDLHTE